MKNKLFVAVASVLLSCIFLLPCLSHAAAKTGTTTGTFVGLAAAGEGNMDFVIKNENGKKEAFYIGAEQDAGFYEKYKQWDKKTAKGKKVIIHWTETGSPPYLFKTLDKLELVDGKVSTAVVGGKSITTIVTKIEGIASETFGFKTKNGDFNLNSDHFNLIPIVEKAKKTKKPIIIEFEDGPDNIVKNIRYAN